MFGILLILMAGLARFVFDSSKDWVKLGRRILRDMGITFVVVMLCIGIFSFETRVITRHFTINNSGEVGFVDDNGNKLINLQFSGDCIVEVDRTLPSNEAVLTQITKGFWVSGWLYPKWLLLPIFKDNVRCQLSLPTPTSYNREK